MLKENIRSIKMHLKVFLLLVRDVKTNTKQCVYLIFKLMKFNWTPTRTCKDNVDEAFADCAIPQEKTDDEINNDLGISVLDYCSTTPHIHGESAPLRPSGILFVYFFNNYGCTMRLIVFRTSNIFRAIWVILCSFLMYYYAQHLHIFKVFNAFLHCRCQPNYVDSN